MTDLWPKVATGIASAALIAVAGSYFSMRDQLNRISAQEPLREQVRALEQEQLRQGIQLNSNELDVFAPDLSSKPIV